METPIQFSIESYNELVISKGTHIVQTRNCKPVRLLCVDRKDPCYPIVGLINFGDYESTEYWREDGLMRDTSSLRDLVIVPKPPVSLGWVVAFRAINSEKVDCTSMYPTKEELLDGMKKLTELVMMSEPIQIFAKP